MSQPRMRKAPVVGGDTVSCARVSVTKASGDTVSSDIGVTQQNQKSSSKNKILKSVRYDLEKTLIGLCDLWFEDIKPHLIRNNIKLHVHGSGGGGGGGYPGSASGDHGRVAVGSPGCSHLDPATTAGICELCRLLFNAENSIESAVSQAANAPTPFSGIPGAAALFTPDTSCTRNTEQ